MSGPAAPVPIRGDDRVSDVLARDESLVDVFADVAPTFERLRNPVMRRVMSRLVTVEQAARIGGIDPALLCARLNAHIGATVSTEATGMSAPIDPAGAARPPALERIIDDRAVDSFADDPPGRIVVCDVRDELRAGREPFSMIMSALRSVPPGGVLAVRAIFEPVPLYAALKKHGLTHWTERAADDDWIVWFYPDAVPKTTAGGGNDGSAGRAEATAEAEGDVVILDVRELEQPEPMLRTLAALEQLPHGATLVQINRRVPQFLLPMLKQRGFAFEIREQSDDIVRLFIRHADSASAD